MHFKLKLRLKIINTNDLNKKIKKILALKTVRKRIYKQVETVQGMTGLCTGDDNSLKVQTGDYMLYVQGMTIT